MASFSCTAECHFSRTGPGIYVCKTHNFEHRCGKACTALKHITNQGTFCTLTGVETTGPAEILYNNPLTTDSFKRKRGGVHWTNERIRHRIIDKSRPKPINKIKQHSSAKILSALRKIFTSQKYEAYILKEKGRRKLFIQNCLRKRAPFTIQEVVKLAQEASSKFPGASKTLMTMKDPRLQQLCESILMYSRNNSNVASLNMIKNTGAFVAAVLTMLATGLEIKGEPAFPRVPWLRKKLPPPVAMTSIGIPCRAVSLAVRHLKKLVYGADFTGVPCHFFTIVKHCICEEADTD